MDRRTAGSIGPRWSPVASRGTSAGRTATLPVSKKNAGPGKRFGLVTLVDALLGISEQPVPHVTAAGRAASYSPIHEVRCLMLWKEEAMSPLFSTIGNGTVQLWEAAVLMAAATSVHAPPPRKKRRAAQLDSRTLEDIGVEPGSITWL